MAIRLLLDENLSEQLIPRLTRRFPAVLHVRSLGYGGAPDAVLWELAAREGCILVTKDEDFVQLSVLRGMPPKVIWLGMGNASTATIAELLLAAADEIDAFIAHPELGFLALSHGEQSPKG